MINTWYPRTEKGRHRVTHALWLWLIFCAALELNHSAVLHLEQSAVSCWQRCLQSHLVSQNYNPSSCTLMWPKTHSHKEHLRPFQMPACTYHKIDLLSNKSVLLAALSIFWAGFGSGWAIPQAFAEGFLRKTLACLCPRMDCKCFSYILLVQSLITPLATLVNIPSAYY